MSKKAPAYLIGCIGVLALGWLGGCGGDEAPTSCALDARVSGAVEWQSSGDPACVIPFGGSAGASMYFTPVGGDVAAFRVEISDVKAGQTGSFPASVEIELRDQRKWTTATTGCTVQIDAQVFTLEDQFRKQYRASGTGQCATSAMPKSGASGTVTVAPFTFTSTLSF